MEDLPRRDHPDLLVGTETSDDAGVVRVSDALALVQTLDFFTPVVDSPYDFGQIAAANALSDVYAMGGTPKTAMNIVCFPAGDLPWDVLRETLRGGLDKVHEAGALLVGGHSVDDKEFKYGLSVTGLVHPDRVLCNHSVRTGDLLVLTKPLGTGVLATIVKAGLGGTEAVDTLVRVASELNRTAADVMRRFSPSACTDITGFGLAGHALEMAHGAGCRIAIRTVAVPFIPMAVEHANMGFLPAGMHVTKKFCEQSVRVSPGIDQALLDLLFDPQTSGGLLVAVAPEDAEACAAGMREAGIEHAAVVGEVLEAGGAPGIDILP